MSTLLQSPAFIAAAIGSAAIWLFLLTRIVGAENLEVGQKWGWAVGLTFLFPVFSVLYLALAPVERQWSSPPSSKPRMPPGDPLPTERHLWQRMS